MKITHAFLFAVQLSGADLLLCQWLAEFHDTDSAWKACERIDWMYWYVAFCAESPVDIDCGEALHKKLAGLACALIRKGNESLEGESLRYLDAVEAWARGESEKNPGSLQPKLDSDDPLVSLRNFLRSSTPEALARVANRVEEIVRLRAEEKDGYRAGKEARDRFSAEACDEFRQAFKVYPMPYPLSAPPSGEGDVESLRSARFLMSEAAAALQKVAPLLRRHPDLKIADELSAMIARLEHLDGDLRDLYAPPTHDKKPPFLGNAW